MQISCAVHVAAQLISAFFFATQMVQSLFFLNPKFPASIHTAWSETHKTGFLKLRLIIYDINGETDDAVVVVLHVRLPTAKVLRKVHVKGNSAPNPLKQKPTEFGQNTPDTLSNFTDFSRLFEKQYPKKM